MKRLIIYYDNPNQYSDMYIKYLQKDCEEQHIVVHVVYNYQQLTTLLLWQSYLVNEAGLLPLMPVKDDSVLYFLKVHDSMDVDNVSGFSVWKDATAMGIYKHIIEQYPSRETKISVIGRGKVGKVLINQLIDYGYTVFEFNSASDKTAMTLICDVHSDVVVGVSTQPVFDKDECDRLRESDVCLIDASATFDTTDKLKCGKWTREELLSRL